MRLRLQPHFLFNALNTISATMYEDVDRADAMIEQLATLLRHSLESEHDSEVALGDELAVVAAYMALIEARFGSGVRYRADVDPSCRHSAVPALLIQPLIENAVRHGNLSRTGHGEISLVVRRQGDRLTIIVEDDGPGVPRERDVLHSGFGLSLTARRLHLMYGDEHRITAGNGPGGGFRVALEFPCRVASGPRRLRDEPTAFHASAAGR
jgi:LytS/YehU family sensor histidine kinase